MGYKYGISKSSDETKREIYESDKRDFYNNPSHWSNNKRRMNGLPVIRGKTNKTRWKRFPDFEFWVNDPFGMFAIIEECTLKTIAKNLRKPQKSFVKNRKKKGDWSQKQ